MLLLQKFDTCLTGLCDHFFRPQRNVNLSDMCLAQEKHTDSGLSDTAADGVGKLPAQNSLLEIQFSAVVAAGFRQLTIQTLGADTEESSRAMSRTG